jgi:Predicted chitinase
MISKAELVRVLDPKVLGQKAQTLADVFHQPLNDAMAEFDVNTPTRVAAFLAQALHESARLTRLRENLNYSAEGLLATFPKYFTPVVAQEYARNPERIANRVYANRMGNGPEESGDGWKYRGVGIFQLTGKDNIRACSKAICDNEQYVEDPALIEQPVDACRSAGWFWSSNKLNSLADQEDMKGITRKINGGYIGLKERQEGYVRILTIFGS